MSERIKNLEFTLNLRDLIDDENKMWIKSSDLRVDDRVLDKMVEDMLEIQIHQFVRDVIVKDLDTSKEFEVYTKSVKDKVTTISSIMV